MEPRRHAPPMFGAVYFRKSNPPSEDWERDYRTAAEDGLAVFRHWCPWGAIEVAPGRFDWADYDRQLDLAAEHGIRTVLAEMLDCFPEWLQAGCPEGRRIRRDGEPWGDPMHVSCVTGGAYAMCLDYPEVGEAAGRFLAELASRYREHPALYAYDVWNECSLYTPQMVCHCPATERAFRQWLRERYGELDALNRAWHRYSYTAWDQVRLPRQVAPYPEVLDAIEFHLENTYRWMRWRVETIRAADPDHLVTAHGNAKSFRDIAPACGDDWRAAEAVDLFGYTYWYANRCHPLMAGDMIRGASRGKEFWRAEAVGDHTWEGRRRGVRTPERDTMHEPEEIRLDVLISLMAGARAYMTPRCRPLLDGPLFGAYGWYGMDGGRTDRSAMVSALAARAREPALAPLWEARPVRGDAAVLICDEAQAHCYAWRGETDFYAGCVQGAYRAFLDAGLQCDLVKPDQIGDYELVYFPFPVALRDATAQAVRAWVEAGGRLVSEACFGYFDGHAHAFPRQPARGFEEVFGCRQQSVSFAPDRWDPLTISLRPGELRASLFRQSYAATTGKPVGWHEDGSVAAVENAFGAGKAVLVGAMPGFAYHDEPDEASLAWFASLLALTGREPAARSQAPGVVARLWEGGGRRFLWAVNLTREAVRAEVTLREPAGPDAGEVQFLRGPDEAEVEGRSVRVHVPARDAVVLDRG